MKNLHNNFTIKLSHLSANDHYDMDNEISSYIMNKRYLFTNKFGDLISDIKNMEYDDLGDNVRFLFIG